MTHQRMISVHMPREARGCQPARGDERARRVRPSAQRSGQTSYHKPSASLDRRRFLTGAAAAVATTIPMAQSLGRAASRRPAWQMRLSTSSLHYRGLPLADACRRIGNLGFGGVDVWSHFEWAGPLCEHLEEGVEKMGPAAFADLLEKNELSLFAASCYAVPVVKYLPALSELGGCVVVRGSRAVQGPETTLTLADLKTQMRQFLESLKPELEMVAKNRCTLAIENHSGKSLLNRLDSIKVFTELNQHEHLGIALAPYHIQRNQESVDEAIRLCGHQLKFFYAWQYADGTKQLPGIGPTDVRPWLQALADVNYRGYVNPFMHHEPAPDDMDQALKTSRDYLRKTYAELFG